MPANTSDSAPESRTSEVVIHELHAELAALAALRGDTLGRRAFFPSAAPKQRQGLVEKKDSRRQNVARRTLSILSYVVPPFIADVGSMVRRQDRAVLGDAPKSFRRMSHVHAEELSTSVDIAAFTTRLERAEALLREVYRLDGFIGLMLRRDAHPDDLSADAVRWVAPGLDGAVTRTTMEYATGIRPDITEDTSVLHGTLLRAEIDALLSGMSATWSRHPARLYRGQTSRRSDRDWSTAVIIPADCPLDMSRWSEDTVVDLMLGELREFLRSEMAIASRVREVEASVERALSADPVRFGE